MGATKIIAFLLAFHRYEKKYPGRMDKVMSHEKGRWGSSVSRRNSEDR